MIDINPLLADLERLFNQKNAPSAKRLSELAGCPRNYISVAMTGKFQKIKESRHASIRKAMAMFPNPETTNEQQSL